jgi:hypothetical protein
MSQIDPQAFARICPEQVARKIEVIRNGEYPELLDQVEAAPRIVEALYFLQWVSMQPGALVKFSADLVGECGSMIGTKHMRSIEGRAYSLEDKIKVVMEIPERDGGGMSWEEEVRQSRVNNTIARLSSLRGEQSTSRGDREPPSIADKAKRAGVPEQTERTLQERCRKAAGRVLPSYFAAMCVQIDKGFSPSRREIWFMEDPMKAVFAMMDRHEQAGSASLAHTEVAKAVFEAIDRTIATMDMVQLWGNSRFGKTEALKAKTRMRPGLMRFVAVPPSNSMEDFLGSVKEAIGIEAKGLATIRAKLRYVLKHGGPVPVFDESAWLFPRAYTKTTAPSRLDWVRSELFDRGLPTIMAATPQWYNNDSKKFVDTRGYAIEQFTGRCERVELPSELSESDLTKVAAFHFPEVQKRSDLVYIASYALREENLLQTIERISKRARYMARQRGLAVLGMPLIREAIDAMFPKTREAAGQPEAAPDREANGGFKAQKRAVKPAFQATPGNDDFAVRSLRGAGLESEQAELVSEGS